MTGVGQVSAAASYRPGGSLWSRLGGSNAFAWGLSLALHGLMFLAFYRVVAKEEPSTRVVIIPEARLVGAPGAAEPIAPLRISMTPKPAAATPSVAAGPSLQELPALSVAVSDAGGPVLPSGSVAATQPSQFQGLGSSVVGSAGSGSLGGGGVVAAPGSSFFGQAGNAYKVVYVVDLSASVMLYADDIAREMSDSISALLPTQRFHIVLATSHVRELGPRRLVPAIASYKRQADEFLQQETSSFKPGAADPIEAMRRAFAVKPELIYFLTDGAYQDRQEELEKVLRELNGNRAVKITVIGFAPIPAQRPFLERLARDHGGHFRVVADSK